MFTDYRFYSGQHVERNFHEVLINAKKRFKMIELVSFKSFRD